VDLPRGFTIRESSHRVLNPFTSEKLALLGRASSPSPDTFHQLNPWILVQLESLTADCAKRGLRRIGIGMPANVRRATFHNRPLPSLGCTYS
jgi:hypothetical protein